MKKYFSLHVKKNLLYSFKVLLVFWVIVPVVASALAALYTLRAADFVDGLVISVIVFFSPILPRGFPMFPFLAPLVMFLGVFGWRSFRQNKEIFLWEEVAIFVFLILIFSLDVGVSCFNLLI